jgi:hypothetical protein
MVTPKRKSPRNGGKEERPISLLTTLCPSITIPYHLPPLTSVPVGKAPRFDGLNYNQWKHCMKYYLYSISPEVWQVICDGVDFPDDDEQPTLDQLLKIHRNAQAISILTSSMDKEEFSCMDGLDVSNNVWTTL